MRAAAVGVSEAVLTRPVVGFSPDRVGLRRLVRRHTDLGPAPGEGTVAVIGVFPLYRRASASARSAPPRTTAFVTRCGLRQPVSLSPVPVGPVPPPLGEGRGEYGVVGRGGDKFSISDGRLVLR